MPSSTSPRPSNCPPSMRRSRPGSYRVDHDKDSIESVSRLVRRQVGILHSPAGIGQRGTTHQMASINPADLDAALEQDRRNHDGFDHSSG